MQAREHAVVIGGSMAGLLAARILTTHFPRVTLLERDTYPDSPQDRAGVPQGRHLHVLWNYGLGVLDGLFPGLEREFVERGVPDLKLPGDLLWLTPQGWRRRFDDVSRLLTFSRGMLDHVVRERLFAEERLTVRTGVEVTELTATSDRRTVTGVRLRERGTQGTGEVLEADLVVDATGRTSRAPEWLAKLGRPFPAETRIDPLLGYATRRFAVPEGFDPGWKALYLQAGAPTHRRTGGLFPQEDGTWICSLSGAGRDYPPTTDDGFLDYARGLRHPVLYDAIKNAEPLTPIHSYRRTAGHRRHYERMRDWPAGFVATGDSVCAFNPIYGQGMTVAARSALQLDRMLGEGRSTRWFQQRAKKAGSGAWLISTGEDRRYAETQGPPVRPHTKALNRAVDLAVRAANSDPVVAGQLIDVLGLGAEPFSLFRPAMARRVLAARNRPLPVDPPELEPRPDAPAPVPSEETARANADAR
ncbi:FAD-dependent monooxygenase [Actinocorallia sp. API 0066]|uniref:NAD(P)/FAD-dependent oxidoreductase n=1 Tax=Actinocorallia sp. API 0066 TaxID=2896846 RepID=UPI001E3C401A|nr:FAD-dependent monooxygenase [Actinocorallia sp. API 0066]MCD0451459.1 FAD-dependent monooxygenase [Actinocorallia sp. API 0066]